MNLAEKLLTAVGIMTDAAVQKAGYDRTVVATIATVDNLETKTYTVQYGDAKHTAKGNAEYKIGDQVYVIIPGEDTLDWQISSLAQGIMSGGSWIDVKDLPPDNLFIDASEGTSLFPTNGNDVTLSGNRYNIWKTQLINEILKGRVYTQVDIYTNDEEKIEDQDLDYYVGLIVSYKDSLNKTQTIEKTFSINDMIGDPRGGKKVSQFGVFSFSQEEVAALNAAKSSIDIEVKLYRSNTNLQMSNLYLFGNQPDEIVLTDAYQVKVIAQNYPIEVDSVQTSIALDIGLYGGNVRIPYSTSMEVYMAKKYFSWDTLTWNISPYSKINLDTNSMYTITTTTALYKESTFYFKIKYADKWYAADGVTIHNLTKDTDYFLVESTLNEKYKIKVSYNDNNDATGRWKIVGANGSFISTDGTTWNAIAEEQIVYEVTGTDVFYIDASLLSKEAVIYRADSVDTTTSLKTASNIQQISIYPISREQTNIQVSGATTFLYDLSGSLLNPNNTTTLNATFYPPGATTPYNGSLVWEWIPPEASTSLIDKFNAKNSQASFEVSRNFDRAKTNNTIIVKTTFNNMSYSALVNLAFVQEGDMGTNGTGIVCRIGVSTRDNAAIDYPMFISTTNNVSLMSFDTTSGKLTQGADSWTLSMQLINTSTGVTIGGTIKRWFLWNEKHSLTNISPGRDIICVEVEANQKTFYGYLPIAYENIKNSLVTGSGFVNVTYEPSGQYPSYFKPPFKVSTNLLSYTFASVEVSNINCLVSYNVQRNECTIIPPEKFNILDDKSKEIFIDFTLKTSTSNNEYKVLLPLVFQYNPYGNAAINGWDGSKVQISDTEVLAPMAGFGIKNDDNTFSGVMLGEVQSKNGDQVISKRGILGRYNSQETFFLNSNDGSASFGVAGKGQIKIRPDKNSANIEGGGYFRYDKNDVISAATYASLTSDEQASFAQQEDGSYICIKSISSGTGMGIDLTAPSIYWGNNNFKVNPNGKLFAKEADIQGTITADKGAIGGWLIEGNVFKTSSSKMESGQYKALEDQYFQQVDFKPWPQYTDSMSKNWNVGSGVTLPAEIFLKIDATEQNEFSLYNQDPSKFNFSYQEDESAFMNNQYTLYYQYYTVDDPDGYGVSGSFQGKWYLDFDESSILETGGEDLYPTKTQINIRIKNKTEINLLNYWDIAQFHYYSRLKVHYNAAPFTLIQATNGYWILDNDSQDYEGVVLHYQLPNGGYQSFTLTTNPGNGIWNTYFEEMCNGASIYYQRAQSQGGGFIYIGYMDGNSFSPGLDDIYTEDGIATLTRTSDVGWSTVTHGALGLTVENNYFSSYIMPLQIEYIYIHYPREIWLNDDNISCMIRINSSNKVSVEIETKQRCNGQLTLDMGGGRALEFSSANPKILYSGFIADTADKTYNVLVENGKYIRIKHHKYGYIITSDSDYAVAEAIMFSKKRSATLRTKPFIQWKGKVSDGVFSSFKLDIKEPLNVMFLSIPNETFTTPTASIVNFTKIAVDNHENTEINNVRSNFTWTLEDLTYDSPCAVTAYAQLELSSGYQTSNAQLVFNNFDNLKNYKISILPNSNNSDYAIKTVTTLITEQWKFLFDGNPQYPLISVLQNGTTALSVGPLGNAFNGIITAQIGSVLMGQSLNDSTQVASNFTIEPTGLAAHHGSSNQSLISRFFGRLDFQQPHNIGVIGDQKIILGIGGSTSSTTNEVEKTIILNFGNTVVIPDQVKKDSLKLQDSSDGNFSLGASGWYTHGSYTWNSQIAWVQIHATTYENSSIFSVPSISIYYPQIAAPFKYTLLTQPTAIVAQIKQQIRTLCPNSSLSFSNFELHTGSDAVINDEGDNRFLIYLNAFNQVSGLVEQDKKSLMSTFEMPFSFSRTNGSEQISIDYNSDTRVLKVGTPSGWTPPNGWSPITFKYTALIQQDAYNYKLIITDEGRIYQRQKSGNTYTYKEIT